MTGPESAPKLRPGSCPGIAELAIPARPRGAEARFSSSFSHRPFGISRARRRCMRQPMPRVPPFDRPATFENLVALPGLYVAEIVGGKLYPSRPLAPLPSVARTALLAMVGRAYSFGQDRPGGWWILVLPELHFGPDVVVPDLAGWRRSRVARFAGPWWSAGPCEEVPGLRPRGRGTRVDSGRGCPDARVASSRRRALVPACCPRWG